jgi:peptidoglycan/LPS O-acetylase OafA/YrhL
MAALVVLEPVLGVGRELTAATDGGYPLVPSPAELTASQWVGNLTLTETWRWHLLGSPESKLHGPAWTLCYEEQFYAVCGLLLVTVPRRFFAGVTVVTAATLALVLGIYSTGGRIPSGFFFDGRWLLFAAGVFVYLHLTAPPGGRRWLIPLLLVVALVGSGWFRYVHLRARPGSDVRPLAFEWIVGFGFALVLLALHRWDRRLMNARALRPVVFCGRMCYSLYLIHWPVTLLVSIWLYRAGVRGIWPTLLITIPVATALSILAARLFFLAVERHFLNSPHPQVADRSASPPAPALVASAPPDGTRERRAHAQQQDDTDGPAGIVPTPNPIAAGAVSECITEHGNAEVAPGAVETHTSIR